MFPDNLKPGETVILSKVCLSFQFFCTRVGLETLQGLFIFRMDLRPQLPLSNDENRRHLTVHVKKL